MKQVLFMVGIGLTFCVPIIAEGMYSLPNLGKKHGTYKQVIEAFSYVPEKIVLTVELENALAAYLYKLEKTSSKKYEDVVTYRCAPQYDDEMKILKTLDHHKGFTERQLQVLIFFCQWFLERVEPGEGTLFEKSRNRAKTAGQ